MPAFRMASTASLRSWLCHRFRHLAEQKRCQKVLDSKRIWHCSQGFTVTPSPRGRL